MERRKNATPHPQTWIIDLDNTVYPASCNLFEQIDVRMGHYISTLLNVDVRQAKRLQKSYLMSHGTTLRGLMDNHGVEPAEFLHYVHDIDLSCIAHDDELGTALSQLPGRKIIYTNGSRQHAENVLKHMRLDTHFDVIFDIIAADYRPKPAHEPLAELLANQKIAPESAVMIDDMAVNLKPAHKLGMTTVWVKTDSPFGLHESEGAHIHHVAEDLKSWVQGYLTGQSL